MKKLIFFMIGLVSAIALQAKTIYLNAGDVWNNSSAVFFVHSWSTAEDATDVQMTLLDGNIYKADINDDHNMVIFLRLAPGKTEVVWDDNNDCWGRTDNQTLDEGKDLFTVTAYRAGTKYSDGTWSAYSSEPVVVPEPEAAKYYIAGSMTDWAAKMVEMTAGNGDTLTATIALEADSLYEFKVVRIQGTDTVWYGNVEAATMVYGNSTGWWLKGEVNVGLQTTKAADYLFIFEKNENNMISVVIPEADPVVEPEPEAAKYYIAGSMTDWAAKMVEMTAGNGDTLTATIALEADSLYEFKVVRIQGTDTVWYGNVEAATMVYGNSTGWWLKGEVNVGLQTTKAADYLFIFEKNENNMISVVIPEADPVVEPEPEVAKYYIAGSMTDWAAKMMEMTAGNGDTLTATIALEADSLYEFKVVRIQGTDTVWYGNVEAATMVYGNSTGWWLKGEVNVGLQTTKADNYLFIFEKNENNMISVVIPEADPVVEPEPEAAKYYIAGSMTDWAAKMVEMTAGNGDTLTATIALEADSLYEFKVVRIQGTDTVWYGNVEAATMVYGNSTGWWLKGEVNVGLRTTKADNYLFIFEKNENNMISVVIPEADPVVEPEPEAAKYYIAGSMTDWAAKMVEMTAGNGDTLTATIALEADSLYEFKVVRIQGTDTVWYGNVEAATMVYGNSTGWWLKGEVNVGLRTTKADNYLFIFEKNENNMISVVIPEADPVVEPEPEVAKYYIAGSMTDWAAKMVEMTAGNGDTLTATIALEADSLYEFKVVRIQGTDTVWYGNVEAATMVYGNSTGWWLKGEVNIGLQTTKAADYLFIFEKNENNMISVVIPEGEPVVEPEPEVAKYYIAGSMTDWAAKMVEMTAGNGDTLTATIALKADSLYEFKVVRIQGTDTVWYGNVEAATMVYGNSTGWWLKGEVNVGLRTTKADNYLFIFEKNENNMISVVIPKPETIDDPELDLGFYLAGDMTNWAEGKVKFENGTITMNLSEVKTYEMKVIEVTAEGMIWYSADGEMNKDNCTDWILYGDVNANIRLVVETAGEYTFNWNADEKKLSVVYPGSATGLDEVSMEGVNAKVLVNGVLYIIRDNKMYNVQGMQVR